MGLKSSERFSDRVENYVRFRPSYPPELLTELQKRAKLSSASSIADVGSGTGIFTALLLPLAGKVFAVEPNAEMRAAAEQALGGNPGFVSVDGSAEATTLPMDSVDLITAAQAFHWFDAVKMRREAERILKSGGRVALIWNERKIFGTTFLSDYDLLLRTRAIGYDQVKHSRIDETAIAKFFGKDGYETIEIPSEQQLNFEELKGRALSSSYAPNVGHPAYELFIAELRTIYDRSAVEDHVAFQYLTRMFLGRLSEQIHPA